MMEQFIESGGIYKKVRSIKGKVHESIIQNQIEYNYFLDVHVRSVTTNVTATVVAQVRDLYEPSALISGLPTN